MRVLRSRTNRAPIFFIREKYINTWDDDQLFTATAVVNAADISKYKI